MYFSDLNLSENQNEIFIEIKTSVTNFLFKGVEGRPGVLRFWIFFLGRNFLFFFLASEDINKEKKKIKIKY
jgi:hypothetical protein